LVVSQKMAIISISQGIPAASPFCKEGLRGIFQIHHGLIEMLQKWFLFFTNSSILAQAALKKGENYGFGSN